LPPTGGEKKRRCIAVKLSAVLGAEVSMELEAINKLYLELSQIATAKTAREIKLENEIVRLRSYVQRGKDLLHPLTGSKEIDEYRERADQVLKETLSA
jgi:hypothetical protein